MAGMCVYWSGAGESGKSTIVKQMKILHVDGFDSELVFTSLTRSITVTVRSSLLGYHQLLLNNFIHLNPIDDKTAYIRNYRPTVVLLNTKMKENAHQYQDIRPQDQDQETIIQSHYLHHWEIGMKSGLPV